MSLKNNINLQVGVKVLLKNDQGKYLLVHRSLIKYPEAQGRWDLVGGRIEIGQPLIKNLQREVKEETGLELQAFPRLIAAQDILRHPDRHIVRLTYVGRCDNSEVVLDVNENDMYRWYDWSELERLDDVDIYFKALLEDKSLWREAKKTKIIN
jgi:8-oxo-dGTP diphosphatase